MERKKVYIIAKEHFDLVWRRCFERDFEFSGQNFIPYADLQELYIKENIKLCKKYSFYCFEIESVAVLDKFLERNPKQHDVISELIKNKRIYIPFTGINITDSNLINGETIVRNYLYGYYYLKDKFGYAAEGTDRNDAFGNSAQLPQIARGFGSKWVYNIVYSPCEAPYWRGLDGSTVYVMNPKGAGSIGGYRKYRPCPVCGGKRDVSCDYCGGRRIDEEFMKKIRFPMRLYENNIENEEIPCFITAGGEEILPNEEIIKWVEENSDKYDVEFIGFGDYKKYYKEFIDNVDNAPDDMIWKSSECNCNNTGVYVSRIKLKQGVRSLENAICTAETFGICDFIDKNEYPFDELACAWKNLLFSSFHDAVTGTVVDAAYNEITDSLLSGSKAAEKIISESIAAYSENDKTITVFNPYGIGLSGVCTVSLPNGYLPDASVISVEADGDSQNVSFAADELMPFGTKTYNIIKRSLKNEILYSEREKERGGDAVLTNKPEEIEECSFNTNEHIIENEFYKITADTHGIKSVFDKRMGKNISSAGEYMVDEWILEHDEGSPWATLSEDMRRFRLSPFTSVILHEKTEDTEKLVFKTTPIGQMAYAVASFEIIRSVTLIRGCDRVMFSADVWWDTQNHRLRIAFPTDLSGNHLYEIPYGIIEREPYEKTILFPDGRTNWASAAGDYPAINWAGIDGECSIALLNSGTPSYQISRDSDGRENIFLSVLRSPSVGTYLHEPGSYSMTAYDGMRDAGNHHFEYALVSYSGALKKSKVVSDGIGFSARLVALNTERRLPELTYPVTDNIRISAVIPSHDRKGIILRVCEYRGENKSAKISIPPYVKSVLETDLKEDIKAEVKVENGEITFDIRHFEIKTFYLKL